MSQDVETKDDLKTPENNKPLPVTVVGGPGRPKGLKNKFTLIKQDMLEVWEEEGGKERFRELFRGSTKDFITALEKIVLILPKEKAEDYEQRSGNIVVFINADTPKTLAKEICVEPKAVSGDVCGVGDGQEFIANIAGDVV